MKTPAIVVESVECHESVQIAYRHGHANPVENVIELRYRTGSSRGTLRVALAQTSLSKGALYIRQPRSKAKLGKKFASLSPDAETFLAGYICSA